MYTLDACLGSEWIDMPGSQLQMHKLVAPHSSTLAWKIPWAEEPGRLQSMGSHRVGHNGSDLAAAAAAGVLEPVTMDTEG